MNQDESKPSHKKKTDRVDEFIAQPRRAVWKLAFPVMLGMAAQTLYSVVDMVFVGWLGGGALAAITFNMPLVFFSIGINFGLGVGVTSSIARALGRRDKATADNTATHALLIGCCLGVVAPAVGLVYRYPIFALLGTPPEIMASAVEYFRITALGFVFTILNVQFRAIMGGEGDTRTPMVFQVGGTVLNLVLDPLLIFGAGLGIAGAAWATVVSQAAVFLAFAYFFFVRRGTYVRLDFARFRPSRPILAGILTIGIPASMQMVIMSVSGMVFNRIIAPFGSQAVAAYGVGGRLDQIYFMPTFALASSMVTLTGMFVGAGRIDLVRSTLYYTIGCGLLLAFGFGILFYAFSPWIYTVFTDDGEIVAMAVAYIRTLVFAFPFITVGMISSRVFQGFGQGLPGLLLTSIRVILVSVPLAYLFVDVLGYGLESIWYALMISPIVASVFACLWINRRLRQAEAEASPGLP
jgi:putative MATE family efflux protein